MLSETQRSDRFMIAEGSLKVTKVTWLNHHSNSNAYIT